MSDFLISNFTVVAFALLLLALSKVGPLVYLAIYSVLAGLNILMHGITGEQFPFTQLFQAVGALVTVLCMMGLLGSKVASPNYMALLAFFGLAPLFVSLGTSILLIATAFGATVVWGLLREAFVLRSMGERMFMIRTRVPDALGDRYGEFQRLTQITLAGPFFVGVILSMLFIFLFN